MILLDLRQLVWRETSTTRFSRRSRVSKMVADDALDDSTGAVRLRGDMEQLSAWLARAMQEGRAALNSLRTSTPEGNDLLEALKRATESEAIPSSMAVTTQSWANRERCTRSSGTRSIASATRRSSTPVCTRERAALAWSWSTRRSVSSRRRKLRSSRHVSLGPYKGLGAIHIARERDEIFY